MKQKHSTTTHQKEFSLRKRQVIFSWGILSPLQSLLHNSKVWACINPTEAQHLPSTLDVMIQSFYLSYIRSKCGNVHNQSVSWSFQSLQMTLMRIWDHMKLKSIEGKKGL